MMKRLLVSSFVVTLSATVPAAPYTVTVDAGKTIAEINRAHLLGVNIAVYNNTGDFKKAIEGPLGDLSIGLIRIPGGSVSDRYYWNGNGVIENRKADPSKYKAPYWQVDYSAYKPGFAVDRTDWGKADAEFIRIDAKTMHEVTRKHPTARNLVTVNIGTGTPELAAEWVRWANIQNRWDVKYWELGNELNGEWEAGHIRPDGSKMNAEKYAKLYVEFAKAMKAVDPSIKIGGPSCDIDHGEEYFEQLLKTAGEHIDFLTLHFYSLRSSLAPEPELFAGLDSLKPITARLDALVEKYQPLRKGKIEYSITEWNSKLPKDQDAYRLFNGLWFSSWIGEMAKCGIDSATVWDMFSGDDNGHGMLVQQGREYVPTGRYWGFWLWSHFMADTLIDSGLSGPATLRVHATRNSNTVYVMLMNDSRTDSAPVNIKLNGFKPAKAGKEITLSSREYFWNPYTRRADWNSGPSVKDLDAASGMSVTVPPYCVKVYAFYADGEPTGIAKEKPDEPELKLLLPQSGFGDLEVEGWVRAFKKGSDLPSSKDLGAVKLSATGGATIRQIEQSLTGAASGFILKPNGPGPVTITAECDGLTVKQTVEFKPVHFEDRVAWNFDNGKISEPVASRLTYAVTNGALVVDLPGVSVAPPNNHILAIKEYPRSVPKERIGGVFFDISVPKNFQPSEARLQVVLQSHGAYWIPCGDVVLKPGESQTVRMEIPDKKFLKVMDQGFAVLFLLAANGEVTGTVALDNLGFLLRPEQEK